MNTGEAENRGSPETPAPDAGAGKSRLFFVGATLPAIVFLLFPWLFLILQHLPRDPAVEMRLLRISPLVLVLTPVAGLVMSIILRRALSNSRSAARFAGSFLVFLLSAETMFFLFTVPGQYRLYHVIGASRCVFRMRLWDSAKEQHALAAALKAGDTIKAESLYEYVHPNHKEPLCPLGHAYKIGRVGEEVECPFHGTLNNYHYPGYNPRKNGK